ncbi:hypothetical protein [Acrocarpospora sp. B8E8]|uniref:hypothetical protein n=1 Tax=Acrocarpospora sp. B8E8 TaxID=3153572 RepID=UPI00325FA251
MSADSGDSQQVPPSGPYYGEQAPMIGPDGGIVLDEHGNPVMRPVHPSSAATYPPGTIRQIRHDDYGNIGEYVRLPPQRPGRT